MGTKRKLSVIIPVYNTEKYLAKTLESILAQTYSDFELIAVNDGSTDGSLDILWSYAKKDQRIRIISHPLNKGCATALNTGLTQAEGEYIAIMDSDDLYLKEKNQAQVQFLETHPDYCAVGSGCLFIDAFDNVFGWEPMPQSDAAMRWRMFFNSPSFHSSLIIRAEALKKHSLLYNSSLKAAVDYDMLVRLLNYGKGFNFKDPLMLYRVHDGSISANASTTQINNRNAISSSLLAERFASHAPSLEQTNRLRRIFFNKPHIHHTANEKSIEVPSKEELAIYMTCLRQYIKTMPRNEASSFLYEEQAFLGAPYLHSIGLADLNLPSLMKSDTE